MQCAQPEAEYVQPIRLSYHGSCHYNALVERAAPPPLGLRPPGSAVLRKMRERECGGAPPTAEDLEARDEDAKDEQDHADEPADMAPQLEVGRRGAQLYAQPAPARDQPQSKAVAAPHGPLRTAGLRARRG